MVLVSGTAPGEPLQWAEGLPGERPEYTLPPAYAWLGRVAHPRIIQEALPFLGLQEFEGARHNAVVLNWAKQVGVGKSYSNDEIPWCGLFVAMAVKRAGFKPVASPLWARNWANFGKPSSQPGLGDVLVFSRGTGGHVGFYIADDKTHFHVLGGNQSNAVTITRLDKKRLLACRRPTWKIALPASVKPYRVAATGVVSTNEA